MNISQMKNMIVLKDLPSNIVDEAIVILKSNTNIRRKETIESRNFKELKENPTGNYELAVKEAEFVIQDYIKKLEKPAENKISINNLKIRYKKLQICSFLLGITTILGIIISIII